MRAFSDQRSAFRKTLGNSTFADCYRLIAVRSIRKPEVSGWNLVKVNGEIKKSNHEGSFRERPLPLQGIHTLLLGFNKPIRNGTKNMQVAKENQKKINQRGQRLGLFHK
jgi:hypothetical protein